MSQVMIECPHCQQRRVQTAAKLRVQRGYLLFARNGAYWAVGCNACVRAQANREAIFALLMGWWCLPWGLWTPVVIVQNLVAASKTDDHVALEEAFALAGMSLDEVTLGVDGMTGWQRHVTAAFAQVVGKVAAASGPQSAEWKLACQAVSEFCEGKLDQQTVARWVRELGAEEGNRRLNVVDSPADRMVMLHAAVEVALADGQLSSAEQHALEQVCALLGFSADVLKHMLARMAHAAAGWAQGEQQERQRALELLGLSEGASAADVAAAHRRMMLRHHPDLVPPGERDEATRRAVELNRARELLLVS